MARVIIKETGDQHLTEADITRFLAQHGIEYGHWDLSPIPAGLLEKPSLTPEEKQQVLAALAAPLKEAREKSGYQSADVVTLSTQTPNLEQILEPFRKEHYHDENEVRLVVDGEGVFSINPGRSEAERHTSSVFDVEMQPGDFISVPAGTWHWFDLTPLRRIKAVRIFESTAGWTAIYADGDTVKAAASAPIASGGTHS